MNSHLNKNSTTLIKNLIKFQILFIVDLRILKKLQNYDNVYLINCRHIKWGSYPVFSPDNSTFPPNFDLDSVSPGDVVETSTTTTFEPKSALVVPVYGPRSGDWFVAAYLAPWNEDVHQEVILFFFFFLQVVSD